MLSRHAPPAAPPSHPPPHSKPAQPPPLNSAPHGPASATAPRPQNTRPLPRHPRLCARRPSARVLASLRSSGAAQHATPTSNQTGLPDQLLPASADNFTTQTCAQPSPGPPPEPQHSPRAPLPAPTHDCRAPREPLHKKTPAAAAHHNTHPQPTTGSRIGRSRELQKPKRDLARQSPKATSPSEMHKKDPQPATLRPASHQEDMQARKKQTEIAKE